MEGVHGDSMHMEVRGPLCVLGSLPPPLRGFLEVSGSSGLHWWVASAFAHWTIIPAFLFKETVSSTPVGLELAM